MKPKKILEAVSEASGIPVEDLLSRKKYKNIANARGVYYTVCSFYDIRPTEVARYVGRNHGTVIPTGRKYRNYVKRGDKEACNVYNQAIKILDAP